MSDKLSSRIVLTAVSVALIFGVAACSKTSAQDNGAQGQSAQTDQSQTASTGNLAPTNGTQATDTSYQQPANQAPQQSYPQPAPVQRTYAAPAQQQVPQDQYGSNNNYDANYQDASYGQPVLQAQQPPPPLPEYSQPPIPGNGYLWTPGYWSYAPQGYFWVPGVWAYAAPSRLPVDAWILGILRRDVSLQLWLLGPICRLLRRH